jgi:AraC-like DNA-binding protein
MEYVGRVPAPPLDLFIDDIYCLTGVPRYRRVNVPPMPSAHLFVNLGGPVLLRDSDPSVPSAVVTDGWFMGVWSRRFLFGEAASAAGALRALEEELRTGLAATPSRGLGLVQHAGGRIAASRGTVPVGALSDAAGVSGNHLAAQFKSHVGVTPKRVARIYRFARLIVSVDARRPVDWPGLAQTAGYFDQAHFGREFKDFTGYTPTEYLALRRRFPVERGFPPDNGPMPAD